jgi:hypothetical protein
MELRQGEMHHSLRLLIDDFAKQKKEKGSAVKTTCDCGCGKYHRRGFRLDLVIVDYDGPGKNRLFSLYFVSIAHATAALAFWRGNAKSIATKGNKTKKRNVKNGSGGMPSGA